MHSVSRFRTRSNQGTIFDMSKRKQQPDQAKQTADAPKRMGRRSVEESRETRRALLRAAVSEFSEKGMSGARIDEIAARAGVTKGAIYTHFDGREDLLVHASRSAIRSLDLMRSATEAEDLPSFMDQTARRLLAPDAKPARMLISELYASAMRSDVIADLLAEWHAEFVKIVEEHVPPGAWSPQAVAVALNAQHVALSHFDIYQSMGIGEDEMVAIVTRLSAAALENETTN